MMTIKSSNHKFNARLVCVTLLTGVIGAALLAGDGPATQDTGQAHADHGQVAPAKLVQLVRDATKRFADVNAATAAGYLPFLGCVSGPDHGAMGYHYVNGALVGDGILDASRPEVMIYEASNGGLQLVGVEFVVIAQTWQMNHTTPPVRRDKRSCSSTARTGMACRRITNFTSGPGGTTPRARSWTGITR